MRLSGTLSASPGPSKAGTSKARSEDDWERQRLVLMKSLIFHCRFLPCLFPILRSRDKPRPFHSVTSVHERTRPATKQQPLHAPLVKHIPADRLFRTSMLPLRTGQAVFQPGGSRCIRHTRIYCYRYFAELFPKLGPSCPVHNSCLIVTTGAANIDSP